MTGLDLDRIEAALSEFGASYTASEGTVRALVALAREAERLREAITTVVDGEWDDLDPDDGLHQRCARAFLRAALSPDTERGET